MLFTTERHGPAGQGYCQGGFSADFTKVREIAVRLITQFLWLLSAAEVMLTFPCSVKCVCCRTAGLSSVDQAASTGKVRSWEHHTRGCSGVVTGGFFFRSEEDEKTSWWEGRTTQWSYFNVFVTMSKFTQTLSLNHDGETDTIYIKKTSNQHKQRLLISSWFRPRVSSRFQQCFNSSPLWDYQRLI